MRPMKSQYGGLFKLEDKLQWGSLKKDTIGCIVLIGKTFSEVFGRFYP